MPELPSDLELNFVQSIDDCMKMKRWLGERRENNTIGLDCETSGLNMHASDARIRMIQIGDKHTGWAVPYTQWGGAAMECLNAWEGDITGHNLSFDIHWLEMHAGWKAPWHRIHDSMIMGQIERPNMPNGLKAISDEFIDPLASVGEKKLKEAFKKYGWGWDTVPINYPDYAFYSALDPVLAVYAAEHFNYGKNFPDAYDLEMSVLRICNKMERSGMRVDLKYSQQKFDELTERAEEAKSWAQEHWGISVTSTQQLAGFFTELGAKFDKFSTKTGAPSVDKNQLAIFEESDVQIIAQVAKFVNEIRNMEKTSNSYFKNFLNLSSNGFVHPNIHTLGARTGRMSVSEPSLQNIPSKDSLVRNAFIPDDDESAIISSDFSQIELRLLAHFSEDPTLQEAFRNADRTGEDFFTNMGKEIYHNSEFSKEDSRRKLVKSSMYGLIYGASTKKIASTASIPIWEMEPVVTGIHETFPGIKKFMESTAREGEMRLRKEGMGYITTGTGRKIPCDRDKVYSLVNFRLQGTAAEIMKQSLIRLDSAGFGDYMRMAIHDECVFNMPLDLIEDAKPEIASIMSSTSGEYAVDLLAEPEGPFDRWGSKYE